MITPAEVENPVVRDMLDELRAERPDLWPLAQRWLQVSTCLKLIHFLSSSPLQWRTLVDLAGKLCQSEEDVRAALSCLMEQRIVVRLDIPEVGATFYQLSDQEPERGKLAFFRDWSRRWRTRLRAADQALGVEPHCDEKA